MLNYYILENLTQFITDNTLEIVVINLRIFEEEYITLIKLIRINETEDFIFSKIL